jgi:hypothetical protein
MDFCDAVAILIIALMLIYLTPETMYKWADWLYERIWPDDD